MYIYTFINLYIYTSTCHQSTTPRCRRLLRPSRQKQDKQQPGSSCSRGSSREVNSPESRNPKKQEMPHAGHSDVILVVFLPAAVPNGFPPADVRFLFSSRGCGMS